HHSPAELETFPDVSQSHPAGQRRTTGFLRDADRDAALFRGSGTPAPIRRRSGCMSIVRNDPAGIYFRRFGNAAARSEWRHYLRGEQSRPTGAVAALRAGILAGQI